MSKGPFELGDTLTIKVVSKKDYLKNIQTKGSETYFSQKSLFGRTYDPKDRSCPKGLMIVRSTGYDDYDEDDGMYFKVISKE